VTRFATTSWSLIRRAASEDDAEAHLALAVLCEAYWYPVYAYVRCLGVSVADAEDLTQAYFARFLEKRVVRGIDRDQGRFRSFLFVSIRNFLNNERDRERALKRGGGRRLVSLDVARAEERLAVRPRNATAPEALFDRTWAETVLTRVHERLEEDARRRGARERYLALRPFLPPVERDPDYAAIAGAWGVQQGAVRVALHRLRSRFGEILREEIGRTVESRAEVDDEGRYLLRALGA
jgi:RNA polymerase sigma-70 factor (ECF subfamily)